MGTRLLVLLAVLGMASSILAQDQKPFSSQVSSNASSLAEHHRSGRNEKAHPNTSVSKQFLYVGDWGDARPYFAGYRLSPISSGPIPLKGSPFYCYFCFLPGGIEYVTKISNQFLVAQDVSTQRGFGWQIVVEYQISSRDGSLTPLAGIDFAGLYYFAISDLVPDPLGKFLYITTMNAGLMVYSVDANSGALTQMWSSPFCSEHCPPDDMLMGGTSDPSGRFLYAQAQDGIYGYAVDRETGAPTAIPGSPFPAGSNGGWPGNILTTDDRGRFLYATDVSGNQIYAFRIDQQSGALTPIHGSPYATGQTPLTVAFQGSNNFLYVGNLNSGDISAYAVHPDGSLVPVKGSPFPIGRFPFFLLPDQTGGNLYVSIVNSTTASIVSCHINRASGSLQSCSPSTLLGGYFTFVTP
jgi:hypothetical protein